MKLCQFGLEQYNKSQDSRVTNAMEIMVEIARIEISEEDSRTTSNENKKDDFFSKIIRFREKQSHRLMKSKAHNLVKTWLEGISKEVAFWG